MQIFLPYDDPIKVAKILDNKRLGKQRIEVWQILKNLLIEKDRWYNHPAVKLVYSYEAWFTKIYFKAMLDEWKRRGYKNTKSIQNYLTCLSYVKNINPVKPHWLRDEFCKRHQSNLLRKNYYYYSQFFKNVPDNLEYLWE